MMSKMRSRLRRKSRQALEPLLARVGLAANGSKAARKVAVDDYETLVVSRPDLIAARAGKETLVVAGASRGGTSLVAYALLAAGYPLADGQLGKRNHEDMAVVSAFNDSDKFRELIKRRNARHAHWGFKLPDAVYAAPWLARELRNPIFVVAFRNPLAIARSKISRGRFFHGTDLGLAQALEHGLDMLDAGAEMLRTGHPVIMIDIEKAQARPQIFLDELFDVLGHRPATSTDEIAQAISSPGYKPLKRPV